MISNLIFSCILHASAITGMPAEVIDTLVVLEAGKPGTVSKNTNGTVDLGVMQINNKYWVPVFANKDFGGDQNLAYQALRDDACYNIAAGSEILLHHYVKTGDLYEAVGRYHSGTKRHKHRYQRKFNEIFNERHGY